MAASVYDFFKPPIDSDPAESVNARDELYALCDDPMSGPVKLITEDLRFADSEGGNIRDCFIENSGFLVVGVIGLQGTGKSSVANLMANNLNSAKLPITEGPFPVQTVDSLIEGHPRTSAGVDLYITQDRVVILDSQPLLSWALSDLHLQQKRCQQGEDSGASRWSIDGFAEMTSLQIVAFLFSVCHVVVCVQDNLSNPDLLRLVDRAASLKPLILTDDLLTASHLTGSARLPPPPPSSAPLQQQPTPAEPRAEIVKPVKDVVDDGGTDDGDEIASGAPESGDTGLGQTPPSEDVAVTREQQQQQHQTKQGSVVRKASAGAAAVAASATTGGRRAAEVDEMAEQQAEVRALVQQLQRLTDYSASLIHVYNVAPAEIFLSPNSESRLSAYRRLLSKSFPGRLGLATCASIGSRILARYAANRRARDLNRLAVPPNADPAKPPVVIDDLDFAINESFAENNGSPPETSMRVSEAEIVADCRVDSVRCRRALSDAAAAAHQPSSAEKTTVETFFEDDRLPSGGDGEETSIRLNAFSREVLESRRAFFDLEKALANPRLFLLPTTNDKGEVPFGCPSYLQCAYRLQEAVLSTPRQQMQPNLTESLWFEFARQTWHLICTSPLFSDYHRLLMNNT